MFDSAILTTILELPTPLIIYIAGPTCAGKTTLAEWLHNQLPYSAVISMDDYYRDFDDPELPSGDSYYPPFDMLEAYHLEELDRDLEQLLNGKDVFAPSYTIAENRRAVERKFIYGGQNYFIVEGLYAFFLIPPGLKIWVDAGQTVRHARRVLRDRKNLPAEISDEAIERYFWRVERATEDIVRLQENIAKLTVNTDN